MKDHRNITIIVLSVSALVLLAMLVGNSMQPQPAYADASAKQGDYILVNGAVGQGNDAVYVINITTRTLIAYYVRGQVAGGRSLEKFDQIDLDKLFK